MDPKPPKTSSQRDHLFCRVILLVLVALILFITSGLVHLQRRYGAVAHWVEIPAEVSLRRVTYFDESNGSMTGRHVTRKMWTFADYTYAVNGATYQGHAVSSHGPDPHTEIPEHPNTVFYNPSQPADAVLVREPPEQGMIITGLLLCLGAATGISYDLTKGFRKERRRKAFLKRKPARPAK